MRILVACEFSGRVRDAFIARGHDAVSCDILPTERPGPHIQGDVLPQLADGWDMLIAFPPCTYLSNSGARWLYPKGALNQARLAKGMKAKAFFMRLYDAPISKICIENPIPSRIYGLPAKTQSIEPFWFGHDFRKKTYLWLKNLPRLTPTEIMPNPQSTKMAGNWFNSGGKDRQKRRSETFQCIADAMAEQWGGDR